MTVVLPTCFFRHDLAMRLARPTEIFSNVANTSRDFKSTIHNVTRMRAPFPCDFQLLAFLGSVYCGLDTFGLFGG